MASRTRRARSTERMDQLPLANGATPRPFSLARQSLVIVVCIIAYASLRPFDNWRDPGRYPFEYLFATPNFRAPFDVLLNIAGYIPLGLALTLALFPRFRGAHAFAIGILLPGTFSILVEGIQTYLPGRYSSVLDVVANVAGAAIGAAIAVLVTPWLTDHRGGPRLRERWLAPGRVTDVGLLVLMAWFLALFAQRTILFGTGDLRANFGAAMDLSTPPVVYWITEIFIITANLIVAGLVLRLVMAEGTARVRWFFILVAAALVTRMIAQLAFWKPASAFDWITPEALFGLVLGSILATLALDLSRRTAALTAIALVAASLIVVNASPPDPTLWLQRGAPRERMLVGLTLVARYTAKGWPVAVIFFLVMAIRQAATPRARLSNPPD